MLVKRIAERVREIADLVPSIVEEAFGYSDVLSEFERETFETATARVERFARNVSTLAEIPIPGREEADKEKANEVLIRITYFVDMLEETLYTFEERRMENKDVEIFYEIFENR